MSESYQDNYVRPYYLTIPVVIPADTAQNAVMALPRAEAYRSFLFQLTGLTAGRKVSVQITLDGTNYVTQKQLTAASGTTIDGFEVTGFCKGVRLHFDDAAGTAGTLTACMTDCMLHTGYQARH